MQNKGNPISDLGRIKSLTELTDTRLDYVLLRRPKISEPDGDVDILVADLLKANEILTNLNYNCFSKTLNNAKYIRYNHEEQRWVHLDVQSNIKLKNFWSPNEFTSTLLKTKILENGTYVLETAHEVIITILHAGVNKGFFDSEYFERVCNVNLKELDSYVSYYSFLPIDLNELFVKVDNFCKGKIKEELVIDFLKNSFPDNLKTTISLIKRVKNRVNSFFNIRRGVAILGPDGSGKSTLILPLSRLQWPSVKKQYMGPSSKCDINKTIFKALNFISIRRERYSKKNIFGVLTRIVWNFICYLDFLERFYRHNWFYGSNGIVFYDRYPCDMYFRKPNKINEFLFFKLFPKPKYVILCVGDPQIIYERKKEEESSEAVKNTIALYQKKLKDNNIKFLEIDTTKFSIEECLDIVIIDLIENKWHR